jgi:hypothetical protein
VNYKQKRGQDHHALIKETVDLWRSVYDGNEETATWFRSEVETMIEQFVRYCLLRLYMAVGTSMADNEQTDAIKAHVRHANNGGSDPEDDARSTRSIYHSARSVPAATTSRPTTLAQVPTTSGSVLGQGRPTTAWRTTRAAAAPATAMAGGGSAVGGASEGGAQADHTAAQADMEDQEEEVTNITPVASTMTNDKVEQILSLLASIQGQESQTAQSSLSALLSRGR